jgi:hypothetical protein
VIKQGITTNFGIKIVHFKRQCVIRLSVTYINVTVQLSDRMNFLMILKYLELKHHVDIQSTKIAEQNTFI